MSSSSSDDSQERFALGFLFALIALILSTVIGVAVHKSGAPSAAAAASATDAPVIADAAATENAASVWVENGVVKFYFASGMADIATGANEALADVVAGVATGKKAIVSGFHDDTGSAAINAELAKQRALSVRDALLALGVTEAQIELNKPEQMLANGTNAEARRVEVVLAGA